MTKGRGRLPISVGLRRALLAIVIASAVVVPSSSAQTAECVGSTFRVFYEGTNEPVEHDAIAKQALDAAESIVALARETFGPTNRERELAIHLHRESADYVRLEGRITGGVFRHNLAFSSFIYKRAHVAIQPECGTEVFRSLGLSSLTRRQIAHEAAHLMSFAAMPSYRHHPEWFSEGAAMWIAGVAMRRKRWAQSIDRDPSTSMRIVLAQRLLRERRMPTVADILAGRTRTLAADERYAIHWIFFRLLKQRAWQRRFDWVLREARALEPGRDFPDRLRERFLVAFPAKETDRMDAAMRRAIEKMKPRWEIDGTPPQVDGTTWWSIAEPDQSVAAWRVEPITKDAGRVTGHLTILPGCHDAVRLLFGRTEKGGFWGIRFSLTEGIAVARYDPKTRDWRSVATERSPFPQAGARVRVDVSSGRVAVDVGGRERLAVSLPDVSIRGRWGIAAEEGAAARWSRMKATR